MTRSSTGSSHGSFGAYTPTVTGSGGGGPGAGGTVVWGPDFGGVDGDRFTATSLLTMPSLTLAHAKTATGTLTMPSLVLAHSKTATGHLSGTALGAPFWQSVETAARTTSGNTIDVAFPSGLVVGDLLLAFIAITDTGTPGIVIDIPAGWTLVRRATVSGSANTTSGGCLYRVVDGTEGVTQTFSASGTVTARRMTGEIHRVNAVDPTTPINVSAISTLVGTALVTDPVSPAVTTTVVNCMVFTFIAHDHLALSQTHSAPAGHLERSDFQSTVTANIVGANSNTRVFAAAASTGTATHDCTETVSTDAVMIRVAVAPGTLVLEP